MCLARWLPTQTVNMFVWNPGHQQSNLILPLYPTNKTSHNNRIRTQVMEETLSMITGPRVRLDWSIGFYKDLIHVESLYDLNNGLFPDSRWHVFLRLEPANSITDQQDSVTQLTTTKHSLALISTTKNPCEVLLVRSGLWWRLRSLTGDSSDYLSDFFENKEQIQLCFGTKWCYHD